MSIKTVVQRRFEFDLSASGAALGMFRSAKGASPFFFQGAVGQRIMESQNQKRPLKTVHSSNLAA